MLQIEGANPAACLASRLLMCAKGQSVAYIIVGFAGLEEALEGDLVASVGSDHGLHQKAGQSQMPALTARH